MYVYERKREIERARARERERARAREREFCARELANERASEIYIYRERKSWNLVEDFSVVFSSV